MAAITSGEVGTFNRTVGVKRDMEDAVDILTPSDVPLQQLLGTDSTEQVKVEWMEEDLTPQIVTGDGSTPITGTGTTGDPYDIVLATGDGTIVRVGDILQSTAGDPSDQWYVQNVTGDALELVLYAGSTHAVVNSDELQIVGQYRAEGSDPLEARTKERTDAYNYTQIYQEAVEATRTARKRGSRGGLWGQRDPYDHEVMKKFKELGIRFERAAIFGQRTISGDSKNRGMGGLFYYITTNSASNTKANASVALNSLLRTCEGQGGNPNVLVVSHAVKEALSQNIDPSLRRNSYQSRAGGFVVDTFMSDFGEVEIVADRHLPTTKGFALEVQYVDVVNFDGFFHELLAKTGDADKGHIVGEKSLRVKNEKAHGVLTITDAS